MKELVPLKVKITLGLVGGKKRMVYPTFNLITSAARNQMDWSYYLDVAGSGMNYDNCCDFDTGQDHQYALMAVPEAFALEAIALFGPAGTSTPGLVERLADTVAELFWNDHVASGDPDVRVEQNTLQALASRKTIGEDLTADPDAVAALDPSNTRPGKVRNMRKTWARFKQQRQIAIKNPGGQVVAPRAVPQRGRSVDP